MGTAAINLGSIYRQGLLIPGVNNNLQVVNGSAHGLGIYTASIDNPGTSWAYCRGGGSMLICGVLDDAVSGHVKHAGGVMVVFDERRVVPLFVATRYTPSACHSERQEQRKSVRPSTRLGQCAVPRSISAFLL